MGNLTGLAVAVGVMAGLCGPAWAQGCLGRPDFDACMARINGGNQQRLAQSQQALFQEYVRTNGPWLQSNYAQHRASGGQMSFAQFAYWGMMTANGTNIEGAIQAQRDQYEGWRRADETVKEGHRSYNQGMYDNSRRMDEATRNFSNGAIRGVAPYVDPRTGQQVMLPYAPQQGVPFRSGGEAYVQGRDGTYYQQQGNGWVPMYAGR